MSEKIEKKKILSSQTEKLGVKSPVPVLMFGKYKDVSIYDVIIKDPAYIQWLVERPNLNEKLHKLIHRIRDDITLGKYQKTSTKKAVKKEDEESDGFIDDE